MVKNCRLTLSCGVVAAMLWIADRLERWLECRNAM